MAHLSWPSISLSKPQYFRVKESIIDALRQQAKTDLGNWDI